MLGEIKSWEYPSNFHDREQVEAETTTLKGSLDLHSLAVRLGGYKIKKFVKLMQEFLKKFDFFLWSVGQTTWGWNHDFGRQPLKQSLAVNESWRPQNKKFRQIDALIPEKVLFLFFDLLVEWLEAETTTLAGSLYLKSLPVRIGGHKIKNFVKSMQEFLKKFDFSRYLYVIPCDFYSWICWANDLRLKPRLWKAASTWQAWPWGLEATKSKISSNRCRNAWKSLDTGYFTLLTQYCTVLSTDWDRKRLNLSKVDILNWVNNGYCWFLNHGLITQRTYC